MGQTCYFGAMLQVLLSADKFKEKLFACTGEKARLLRALVESQEENRRNSMTKLFIDNSRTHKQFENPRLQGCATELLELYLASLDQESDPLDVGVGIACTSFGTVVEEYVDSCSL